MLNFIKLSILSITALLLLSSCAKYGHQPRMEGPQMTFEKTLQDKNTHPDFRQGWHDGCEVGNEAGSKSFYKSFTKTNKIDGWKLSKSKDYQKAWNYAFWYCYRDDYVDHKSTAFSAFFRGWH
ncbi:MAG: hypothetical protein O3B09_00545 [Proteobacteria bacterium]|nr:hypothetical protein [Pseudomonadota bacterium]